MVDGAMVREAAQIVLAKLFQDENVPKKTEPVLEEFQKALLAQEKKLKKSSRKC